MANKRTSMEKIREVLRMRETGLSGRQIAKALRISRPVVSDYLKKFEGSGLAFAVVSEMGDEELLRRLGAGSPAASKRQLELIGNFPRYARELKRLGVTLALLWEEYFAQNPNGYRYSQFAHLYRQWKKDCEVSMHMEHKAGEKAFVDFTGDRMKIVDPGTGEVTEVEVFVAILGASQLTFAVAKRSQKKADWIEANEEALLYFGGVPRAVVPDCLKSAVTRACRYEPEINPEYFDFARHYGTTILPARPNKPKDKPLAENAVKLVYQRVFAPLRDRVFFSLDELNEAIRERIDIHNERKMQKLKVSRRELFAEIEQAELLPLPAERYEFKKFQQATVQFNYHVYLKEDQHYYSVPYRYKGRKIRLIYTNKAIEAYFNNERIARHRRISRVHGYTTDADHMPSHHKFYSEWNPERFMQWSEKKGEYVRELVGKILLTRKHPEQAYKSSQGVLRLADKFGDERLNAACRRAIYFGNHAYHAVRKILEQGLDRIDEESSSAPPLPFHENIRGENYYEQETKNEQRIDN